MKNPVYCVIPNWNGKASLGDAIESLQKQSQANQIIVVENGSSDGSKEFVAKNYPEVVLLPQPKNLGFAGGVNKGLSYAIEHNANYVALFNNDAVADKNWLKHLLDVLENQPSVGIATCKLINADNTKIDSTGDQYTCWGLPFPRGRNEPVSTKYDHKNWIFSASGGASLYRVKMLQAIGLFDEDFFAYYEDMDISFRAQLSGWKVYYEPKSIAFHQIGATSSKIKGFSTYQTLKNLPFLVYKNVPAKLLPSVLPRFTLAYWTFIIRALVRGQFVPVFKGVGVSLLLTPKKLIQRHAIKKRRSVSTKYISSIMIWDVPPDVRAMWPFNRKAVS